MAEWEAIFLEVPRLFEPVEVVFMGKRCQTSHISNIQKVEGTDPLQYRVKTLTGTIYMGPVGEWIEPEPANEQDGEQP